MCDGVVLASLCSWKGGMSGRRGWLMGWQMVMIIMK